MLLTSLLWCLPGKHLSIFIVVSAIIVLITLYLVGRYSL